MGNELTCQYHNVNESVIHDLRDAVKQLVESHQEMRVSVMQLTEALKSMERIERKIDKLEEEHREDLDKMWRMHREKDKEQDTKIEELKAFVYKISGAAVGAGGVIGFLMKFFIGG